MYQRTLCCHDPSQRSTRVSQVIQIILFALLALRPRMLEGMSFIKSRSSRTCVFQHARMTNQRLNTIHSLALYARKRKFSPLTDDSIVDDNSNLDEPEDSFISSPMDSSDWKWKELDQASPKTQKRIGRGRSAKRSNLYQQLSSYHSTFLALITTEYRAEESEVVDRLKKSINDPISLEMKGYALFDMYPERRGDIFTDEVYRLLKAHDATVKPKSDRSTMGSPTNPLPDNHKFSQSDVIMLTLQPLGSGDFLGTYAMPLNDDAVTLEARVLNIGPTYLDISIPSGKFEQAFGPAPNNYGPSGKGDPNMRLRVDRFFSDVSYRRMVHALSQATSIPSTNTQSGKESSRDGEIWNMSVDDDIRRVITSTFDSVSNDSGDSDEERIRLLNDLTKGISSTTVKGSKNYADQVIKLLQTETNDQFPRYNEPQLASIRAALTRKLTMIQGPPGTGKTTVAGAIAYGFVHQCRQLPYQAKVLACAFSNVGADNLVEQMLRMGLHVVRVGKASSVSPKLLDFTLDSAIAKDPDAQRAMEEASRASMKLRQLTQTIGRKSMKRTAGDGMEERRIREKATLAVKASIKACNIAATKAMRQADVIVSTCIGAADSRLLAACGFTSDDEEDDTHVNLKKKHDAKSPTAYPNDTRGLAPDRMPPIYLPFVILDESCQSVEPATLVPIFSSNSCQSIVMLGDPCQLPPTVISDESGSGASQLSLSLMSRLAMILQSPLSYVSKQNDGGTDETFLSSRATKQAKSLIKFRSRDSPVIIPKKKYSGSLLLSIQYRMHPSISAFPSAIFYDGMLHTPSILSQNRRFPIVLGSMLQAEDASIGIRFINISGNNEIRGASTSLLSEFQSVVDSESPLENFSISNRKEAQQVVSLMKEFLSRSEKGERFAGSIGVVTPYSAQVSLLESLVSSDTELLSLIERCNCTIEINSVDAYQGRERDIIIFSTVRSNNLAKVGFLSDWRRMNVALTRAKSALIVVGDLQTLKQGDMHWEAFCIWLETYGCVHDAVTVV